MTRIIMIEANEFGGHDNMTIYTGDAPEIDGWAEIPEEMILPFSFPFVDIEVEDGIVTSITQREVPPSPPEPEEQPTTDEILDALLGVGE